MPSFQRGTVQYSNVVHGKSDHICVITGTNRVILGLYVITGKRISSGDISAIL
jgi:hypothetical protein